MRVVTVRTDAMSENVIRLRSENIHQVTVGGKTYLLVVPHTALFQPDDVSSAVLDYLKRHGAVRREEIFRDLTSTYGLEALQDVLGELVSLGVIGNGRQNGHTADALPLGDRETLTTLVLNVSNRCNMGCHYCYGGGFQDLQSGQQMSWSVAKRSVDFLLQRAGSRRKVTLVFFGGEPLLNFELIKRVVLYARRQATERGLFVDFTITTNGTGLTGEVIDFLKRHRFGVTVSLDGPKEIHDRRRVFKNGRGTYEVILPRIRALLDAYRDRPIGARVTLTRGVTAVGEIFAHLIDLGFAEVGFSPVTAGPSQGYTLTEAELERVFNEFEELAEQFLKKALNDEYLGFSNLSQIITDFARGTSKTLPCGAGLGLLDVDHNGDIYLCHRFAGTPGAAPLGNVGNGGPSFVRIRTFLNAARTARQTACHQCWIRRMCAGGCYHEALSRYGDPFHPNLHYCDLLRQWMETGLRIYLDIMQRNPGFIRKYLEPRRVDYETL